MREMQIFFQFKIKMKMKCNKQKVFFVGVFIIVCGE